MQILPYIFVVALFMEFPMESNMIFFLSHVVTDNVNLVNFSAFIEMKMDGG